MFKTKYTFYKYYDDIIRFQYKNFSPTSTLNLNAENKKTIFKLDLENEFISKNIEYYIAGKFSPVDARKS